MKIETNRLFISEATKDDALDILYIHNTDYVREYNLFPIATLEDILKILENDDLYKLVNKENNKTVGIIRVTEDYHRYNVNAKLLVIFMLEEYASQGYMSEALPPMFKYLFQFYDLLSGYIFTENKASLRVSEKMGWVNEGTLRHAVKDFKGQIHDVTFLSLTKEDYIKKYN